LTETEALGQTDPLLYGQRFHQGIPTTNRKTNPRPSQPDRGDLNSREQFQGWSIPDWFSSFEKQWQDSLEGAQKLRPNSFWEGKTAAKNLESVGYLAELNNFKSLKTYNLLRVLAREIEIYDNLYGLSLTINRDGVRLKNLLRKVAKDIASFKGRAESPYKSEFVRPLANLVNQMNSELSQRLASLKERLQDSPASEFARGFVDAAAWDRGEDVEIEYATPVFALEMDSAVSGWKIPSVTKTANLDTRRQLRLAAAVKYYFPRASWPTIARLVVLAHICADLVKVKNGQLILRETGSSLTVPKLEKKILKARPRPVRDR